MNEPVEGHVLTVINDRELALNVGRLDGVAVGMRFTVVGSVLIDDVTGKQFTVSVPKTQVKIVRLDGDHVAIGRTFRTIKGTPPTDFGQAGLGSMLVGFKGTPDRIETLRADDDIKIEYDRTIRRGDRAVQEIRDDLVDTT